jgi:hypothetical protein
MSIFVSIAGAVPVSGQGTSGAVRGVAKSEDGSSPIPFALVRLLPADSQSAAARQGITNAQGRFQFDSVPVGAYRLRLLRIGYRPVLSPVIDVRAGETIEHELRASMTALPLPTVVVYGDGACLSRERAASDAYLSSLWDEVREGIEIRRAFDLRYRYKRELAQSSETLVPNRQTMRRQRADTVASEPDSVLVREARVRARREAEGFGKGNSLTLPDERELFDDAFLRTHCLEPAVLDTAGATGVRFRQTAEVRGGGGFGLRGTIWVDSANRFMRRLELEYLNGDKPLGNVTVDYRDVAVAGTALRLPVAGSVSLRPVQAPRGTTVMGTFSFNYWGFEEIRPQ